ncbi:hypothetical protein Ancab_000734 [Ancistrocladus abbreviatus]
MVWLISINLPVCTCPPRSEALVKELSPQVQPRLVISSQPSCRTDPKMVRVACKAPFYLFISLVVLRRFWLIKMES